MPSARTGDELTWRWDGLVAGLADCSAGVSTASMSIGGMCHVLPRVPDKEGVQAQGAGAGVSMRRSAWTGVAVSRARPQSVGRSWTGAGSSLFQGARTLRCLWRPVNLEFRLIRASGKEARPGIRMGRRRGHRPGPFSGKKRSREAVVRPSRPMLVAAADRRPFETTTRRGRFPFHRTGSNPGCRAPQTRTLVGCGVAAHVRLESRHPETSEYL